MKRTKDLKPGTILDNGYEEITIDSAFDEFHNAYSYTAESGYSGWLTLTDMDNQDVILLWQPSDY